MKGLPDVQSLFAIDTRDRPAGRRRGVRAARHRACDGRSYWYHRGVRQRWAARQRAVVVEAAARSAPLHASCQRRAPSRTLLWQRPHCHSPLASGRQGGHVIDRSGRSSACDHRHAGVWLALLAGLLGRAAWPFDLFAHFRVQYAALFVLLALLLLILGVGLCFGGARWILRERRADDGLLSQRARDGTAQQPTASDVSIALVQCLVSQSGHGHHGGVHRAIAGRRGRPAGADATAGRTIAAAVAELSALPYRAEPHGRGSVHEVAGAGGGIGAAGKGRSHCGASANRLARHAGDCARRPSELAARPSQFQVS